MRKLSVAGVLVLALSACGVFGTGDDEAPPSTPPPPPTGSGGGGPPAPPPPPVDGTPLVGVFVSSSKGLDENDGVVSRPMKTLAKAMARAKELNQPVIACAETYAEALVLVNGVTLYGYFDCTPLEWKRVDKHAIVNSPTSPAVIADKLDLQARIEGFDFNAPDIDGKAAADKVARSSIGMLVTNSAGLALANVSIRGGNAEGGADGVEPAPNQDMFAGDGVNGRPAYKEGTGCTDIVLGYCDSLDYYDGASEGVSKCLVGANGNPGGVGGSTRFFDPPRITAGAPGGYYGGFPQVATATQAAGAPAVTGPGNVGGAGAKGATGNAGSNGSWSFTGSEFAPGNGTPGTNGGVGQGGGGGGGTTGWLNASYQGYSPTNPTPQYWYGGGGAGGGAGGCAGLAGTPGRGGGASIGLLSIDSQLSMATSVIEARAGGAAGKGALGTTGLPGGAGGASPQVNQWGGKGGRGGDGGDGGPSGHGSAGPSIAFAFKGARPNVEASTTLTPGTPGGGQPQLARGSSIVPAVNGEAKAEHAF